MCCCSGLLQPSFWLFSFLLSLRFSILLSIAEVICCQQCSACAVLWQGWCILWSSTRGYGEKVYRHQRDSFHEGACQEMFKLSRHMIWPNAYGLTNLYLVCLAQRLLKLTEDYLLFAKVEDPEKVIDYIRLVSFSNPTNAHILDPVLHSCMHHFYLYTSLCFFQIMCWTVPLPNLVAAWYIPFARLHLFYRRIWLSARLCQMRAVIYPIVAMQTQLRILDSETSECSKYIDFIDFYY